MVPSCLSLISLLESYLRRSFIKSGLSPQSISIDAETTIHFWGPKNLQDYRPSLILIHGFGPNALWQWRQQVLFFSPYFNVYVPDLIFFGKSTTKSVERSEIFQAKSIGKLMEKMGVEKYSVMGTSYGGFVAYHMAAMWPERVEKVVIASSAVNIVMADNKELMENRAKIEKIEHLMLPENAAQLRNLTNLALIKPPAILPDFLLNAFLNKLYSENRKQKIELLKGLTLGRENTTNISPLTQDVLIIWGDHDQIFLLDKAIELKEIMGERARLEVIKNTSHVPQIEKPSQFNNIVKDFLCI